MVRKAEESLYRSEEEVALKILGPGRFRDWKDRVAILERQGMPQIDPLMGGRYMPAVLAFFDRLNGLSDRVVPSKPDGAENLSWRSPKAMSSHSQRKHRASNT